MIWDASLIYDGTRHALIFGTRLYFFLACLLSGGYEDKTYLRGLGRIKLAGFGIVALAAGGIGVYMAIFRSISGGHRTILVFSAALFLSGAAVIFRQAFSGGERDNRGRTYATDLLAIE